MKRKFAAVLLTCFGLMTTTPAINPEAADAGARFRALADHYFSDVVFHFGPTGATQLGFHQYDTKLEDYSRAGVEAEIAALRGYEGNSTHFPRTAWTRAPRATLPLSATTFGGTCSSWRLFGVGRRIPTPIRGDHEQRVRADGARFCACGRAAASLIAREKQMPAVLTAARQNLKNPPRIYTEIALEQLPDIIGFFQHDVPDAFKGAKVPAAIAEFHKTNAAVIAALESYQGWLKNDLLPKSNGEFRIGAETFGKKLLYDEMVDTPLDRLLQIGYDDLHKNQAEFNRLAKDVDPGKTPKEVLAELAGLHPPPDQLLQTFHNTFNSLIAFIRRRRSSRSPRPWSRR